MKSLSGAFSFPPSHWARLMVWFEVISVRLWRDYPTSLNDTTIRSVKPSAKPFKVSDSHGLSVLINPGSSGLWYLKYRINGKESRLGLGAYPDVSLAYARQQRDGIRKLLAQKINPAQQRIARKAVRSPEKHISTLHWAGISATEHGHRTTPSVCLPVSGFFPFHIPGSVPQIVVLVSLIMASVAYITVGQTLSSTRISFFPW